MGFENRRVFASLVETCSRALTIVCRAVGYGGFALVASECPYLVFPTATIRSRQGSGSGTRTARLDPRERQFLYLQSTLELSEFSNSCEAVNR